jgi:hypothetical protein
MSISRNVIFRSTAFNTTEPKDYFINDCCFGDDVAKWLITELRKRGVAAEEQPGQEDFGWYINFRAGELRYCLLISYRPGEDGELGDWMLTLERICGALGFLFGAANRGIELPGAQAIHAVLTSSPQISDIRWFIDSDFKTEENAKPEPSMA